MRGTNTLEPLLSIHSQKTIKISNTDDVTINGEILKYKWYCRKITEQVTAKMCRVVILTIFILSNRLIKFEIFKVDLFENSPQFFNMNKLKS